MRRTAASWDRSSADLQQSQERMDGALVVFEDDEAVIQPKCMTTETLSFYSMPSDPERQLCHNVPLEYAPALRDDRSLILYTFLISVLQTEIPCDVDRVEVHHGIWCAEPEHMDRRIDRQIEEDAGVMFAPC